MPQNMPSGVAFVSRMLGWQSDKLVYTGNPVRKEILKPIDWKG